MINNLTKDEIEISISKIRDFNGLNYLYTDNKKSSYIFNLLGESIEILFDNSLDISLQERHKLNNLIKWNSEITIKVIHLKNTFIYMSTCLDRFTASRNQMDQQYFRYFAEIITYYFVSVRDCILQLINTYINSPITKEYQVSLSKVKENLKGNYENILEIVVNDFENNTENFRQKIRNGFTHKTNPFNNYYISKLESDRELGLYYSESIENNDFCNLIIDNLLHLSNYIEELRKLII